MSALLAPSWGVTIHFSSPTSPPHRSPLHAARVGLAVQVPSALLPREWVLDSKQVDWALPHAGTGKLE